MKLGVELETRTIAEVKVALELLKQPDTVVTRVMLDNMVKKVGGGVDVSMLKEALKLLGGRVETEASGNITVETVGEVAATGVTYVSCGALTHSVTALDISFNIDT